MAMADSVSPLVAVVVLNYNGQEHLAYCLPSITATRYPNLRILLVDNASTDGSVEAAAALCPGAVVLRSSSNRGWSGGNNLGIAAAIQMGAKYIILANSDIRVDPRWVDVAVTVAEQNPRIGVIGFDVHEPDLGCADRDAGFEQAKLAWHETATSIPLYVGGMAMFVRAQVFKRVGLIDENFFAYGEENDFQIRAQKAGYRVVAVNVPVWHHGQGSFGKMPLHATLLQTQNNIQLLVKHASAKRLAASAVQHVWGRCLAANVPLILTPVERRLRSSGPLANLAILGLATLRVIPLLPSILRRRWEDDRQAHQALVVLEAELRLCAEQEP